MFKFKLVVIFPIILFGVLFFAKGSLAKTLYVDGSTGNDLTSYANNSQSTPWATIGRAAWGSTSRSSPNSAQAAQAGDTVIVKPGTYTTNEPGAWNTNIYRTANSGTVSAPITFRAETKGTVILQSTNGVSIIGCSDGKNYITWNGFYIDAANLGPASEITGIVVMWEDGCQLLNTEIKGRAGTGNPDNLHIGIFIENAASPVVKNCKISGITHKSGGAGGNVGGIMTYCSTNVLFEHNEIYGMTGSSYMGIYLKWCTGSTDNSGIIRYNLLHDIGGSALQFSLANGVDIYQNIVYNVGTGVRLFNQGGGRPINMRVVNNVFDSTERVFEITGGTALTGNKVYNNIEMYNTDRWLSIGEWESAANGYLADTAKTDLQYNCYYNQSGQMANSGTNYYPTFSTYRAACPNQDVSSFTLDPQVVDRTNHSYKLAPGSRSINAGIDILNLLGGGTSAPINLGAYVTGNETIGLVSQSPDTTPPAAPTGVRVS